MSTRILVVDDSPMIRDQIGRALADVGYSILDATDGVDALKKLAGGPEVSLIVCDVNMPRMNGVEFLERLRANGSTLPVVMLTTETQTDLIKRARTLGARGWIVKPFRSDLFVTAIKKVMGVA